MKGMGNMMKQAQKLQAKMIKLQDKLAERTVTASAGGGMIEVTMWICFRISSWRP
jgi:nucleoid-associated protein EbfC